MTTNSERQAVTVRNFWRRLLCFVGLHMGVIEHDKLGRTTNANGVRMKYDSSLIAASEKISETLSEREMQDVLNAMQMYGMQAAAPENVDYDGWRTWNCESIFAGRFAATVRQLRAEHEEMRESLKDARHRVRWMLQYVKDIDVAAIEAELTTWDAAQGAARGTT